MFPVSTKGQVQQSLLMFTFDRGKTGVRKACLLYKDLSFLSSDNIRVTDLSICQELKLLLGSGYTTLLCYSVTSIFGIYFLNPWQILDKGAHWTCFSQLTTGKFKKCPQDMGMQVWRNFCQGIFELSILEFLLKKLQQKCFSQELFFTFEIIIEIRKYYINLVLGKIKSCFCTWTQLCF